MTEPDPTPMHYPDQRQPSQHPPIQPEVPRREDVKPEQFNPRLRTLADILGEVKRLFRVSRFPRADPGWPYLRDLLEIWERKLESEELYASLPTAAGWLKDIRYALHHPTPPPPASSAEGGRNFEKEAIESMLMDCQHICDSWAIKNENPYSASVTEVLDELDDAIRSARAILGLKELGPPTE